jgi:hypothetical protein
MPLGAIEFVTEAGSRKKGFSQPADPCVISRAGGELKERGHLLRRVLRKLTEYGSGGPSFSRPPLGAVFLLKI